MKLICLFFIYTSRLTSIYFFWSGACRINREYNLGLITGKFTDGEVKAFDEVMEMYDDAMKMSTLLKDR